MTKRPRNTNDPNATSAAKATNRSKTKAKAKAMTAAVKTSDVAKATSRTRRKKAPIATGTVEGKRSVKPAGRLAGISSTGAGMIPPRRSRIEKTERVTRVTADVTRVTAAIDSPPSSISIRRTVVETATHVEVSDGFRLFDWSLDSNGHQLPQSATISNNPKIYRINDGSLLVTTDAGVVEYQRCEGAFEVNLPQDSALLAALDPDGQPGGKLPIELTFQNPLSAVGAYVTAEGSNLPRSTPLHAFMWYQLSGSSQWLSVSGFGIADDKALLPEAPQTAPFVRASGGAQRISKVGFDAKLKGNYKFRKLVISQLLWQA